MFNCCPKDGTIPQTLGVCVCVCDHLMTSSSIYMYVYDVYVYDEYVYVCIYIWGNGHVFKQSSITRTALHITIQLFRLFLNNDTHLDKNNNVHI